MKKDQPSPIQTAVIERLQGTHARAPIATGHLVGQVPDLPLAASASKNQPSPIPTAAIERVCSTYSRCPANSLSEPSTI